MDRFKLGCAQIGLSKQSGDDDDAPTILPKFGVDPTKMYIRQPDLPSESEIAKSVKIIEPSLAKRLVPLLMLFGFFAFLAYQFSDKVQLPLDEWSFAVAMVVAVLTGATWSLMNNLWNMATHPYRPKRAYTPEAANKVMMKAYGAMVKYSFLIALLILIAIFIVRSMNQFP